MNTQLPAYLQGKPARQGRIAEAAVAGIGASLPPHISIRGNAFTLIDKAGAEQPIGAVLDCCIVDVCDVIAKRYYAEKWTPDSNDPPVCWSSNGVAPSIDAITPQARTCAECPHNERGSAVSAISGASIKACRDEKLLAVMPIQYPSMLFQLVLTPGSFSPKDVAPPAANWRDYLKKFEGQQFDLNDVVTRIAFQPKVNGVLTFAGVAHLADMAVIQARNNALVEKKTDLLVGRLDRPRDPSLGLPARQEAGQARPQLAPPVETAPQEQPAFGGQAADPAPTGARRGRKPKAEQQANGPIAGQTAPFMESQAPGPLSGSTTVPSSGVGQGGFGIQPGVAPNPELAAALDSVFGKQ